MFERYRKWRTEGLREEKGIIVAADIAQEWLLPWWWEHYSRHNSYPVSFVNLGLTEKTKHWCQERGELIALPIPDFFVKEKEEIAPELIQDWEEESGTHFWPNRSAWFKKPFACLQSPYSISIWSDLDCEVRGSLSPLFDLVKNSPGIAMVPSSPTLYNGGVIVFQHKLPLLLEWTHAAVEKNHLFRDDQQLLSHLIREQKLSISELPPLYNWDRCKGEDPNALIYHWHGRFGKCAIQHQIWLRNQ